MDHGAKHGFPEQRVWKYPRIGYGKRSDAFLANGLLKQLFGNPMQLEFL